MIDTVILQTIISSLAIIEPKRFNPPIESWALNWSGYRKFINNPTEADEIKWGYCPRLTLYQRGKIFALKMEFSASKMLFEDNINELEESDFIGVIDRLREVVKGMGVSLTIEQIRRAEILGFHPSKNIILGNGYNSTLVIGELKKVDISRKLDNDCKAYRNGGEVSQFYTNLHGLSLYDKIRDLKKPAKRAFDKDQTIKQLSLFDTLSGKIEILRIEARLKKKKFEDIFKKIGYDNFNPAFEDVFNKDLCQKILKYYWSYFFEDNLFLFDMRNSPQKILKIVLDKYKGKKMNLYKLFGLVGFVLCSKDDNGMIGVRNIIEFYKPKNNWGKTKKWLEDFKKDLDKSYLHGFIKDIETQLDEFKPFRIEENGAKTYPLDM